MFLRPGNKASDDVVRTQVVVNREIPKRIFVLSSVIAALLVSPLIAEATPERGPAKVVEVVSTIASSLKASRYQHHTVVRASKGEYHFDCSGMAEWVLRRSAPAALQVLGRPQNRRPLARNYYRHLARIPLGTTRGPWLRVADVGSARPGDIITWERPPWFPSKSTGHVAFVMSQPVENTHGVRGYVMRVADASRFRHQDDTRGEDETGFGMGLILLATDDAGQAVGYGWYGALTPPDWIVPVKVALGRPTR